MEERAIHILLTRSGTWFSRLIHLATQDDYTHASIGLDGPAGPFYSFARKYEHFALPAGLVEEQVTGRRRAVHCCLYELRVSQDTYIALRRQLQAMYAQREEYHYSVLGAFACYFNLSLQRRHHFFCSQFVAELLQDSGAVPLRRAPCFYLPNQFAAELPALSACREVLRNVI